MIIYDLLFQFSLFILKNVKNYFLIIFDFFLLFSLLFYIQTETICEKKNIYEHIYIYIYTIYTYLYTKNFLPERKVNYFQGWQFLKHSDNFLYYYIVSLQLY